MSCALILGGSSYLIADLLIMKQMYNVLERWEFKEDEAESQFKRAALNALLILDGQYEARSRLAESMAWGRSPDLTSAEDGCYLIGVSTLVQRKEVNPNGPRSI